MLVVLCTLVVGVVGSNVPLHLAYCVGMLVASTIGPKVPLYKTYSYGMLVLVATLIVGIIGPLCE